VSPLFDRQDGGHRFFRRTVSNGPHFVRVT
jgi:hypothetical protein